MSEDGRDAWNDNAAFWDAHMNDENDFVRTLIWPATERLLALGEGERVLDVACGTGLSSRRLRALGAEVCAVDFAENMITAARARGGDIDYRVVDACDEDALAALGSFDAASCTMALMDMAEIAPLYRGLARVLPSGGRFVFSVSHPAFNNPWTVQLGELEDRDGDIVTTYAVKTSRYLTPGRRTGRAMHAQPTPHPYFHRPLGELLAAAFDSGLVLDALEERAFPAGHAGGSTPLSWSGVFSELPPVLVVRLRRP